MQILQNRLLIVIAAFIALMSIAHNTLAADQANSAVKISNSDIGGTVTGPNGAEAGVWVVAETLDLASKFAKMVVTDDKGCYLIPELPAARYQVWVRGYGTPFTFGESIKP